MPFIPDNHIYIGDSYGSLYKYSFEGELLGKLDLGVGVTSRLSGNNYLLSVLADNGILYLIDLKNLTLINQIIIDEIVDTGLYIYKSPLLHDDKIFIGTDDGEMIIINIEEAVLEERIKISDSSIGTTIFSNSDVFFISSIEGEIFRLEKVSVY